MAGRDPKAVPDAIATAWALVTEDAAERERVLHDLLWPLRDARSQLERLADARPHS